MADEYSLDCMLVQRLDLSSEPLSARWLEIVMGCEFSLD